MCAFNKLIIFRFDLLAVAIGVRVRGRCGCRFGLAILSRVVTATVLVVVVSTLAFVASVATSVTAATSVVVSVIATTAAATASVALLVLLHVGKLAYQVAPVLLLLVAVEHSRLDLATLERDQLLASLGLISGRLLLESLLQRYLGVVLLGEANVGLRFALAVVDEAHGGVVVEELFEVLARALGIDALEVQDGAEHLLLLQVGVLGLLLQLELLLFLLLLLLARLLVALELRTLALDVVLSLLVTKRLNIYMFKRGKRAFRGEVGGGNLL